jgi:hypothetical protein
MAKQKQRSPKYPVWIDAGKRYKLSHAHIQMARELGMNPKKFGKLDNHRQEPWKAPLPIFIENLYFKRFGKEKPLFLKLPVGVLCKFAVRVARPLSIPGNLGTFYRFITSFYRPLFRRASCL